MSARLGLHAFGCGGLYAAPPLPCVESPPVASQDLVASKQFFLLRLFDILPRKYPTGPGSNGISPAGALSVNMRIATWNINGLRARHQLILHWLANRQPDIVGLQELKITESEFPWDIFKEAGYHAVVHGQKAWNGVAILSRQPIKVTQSGLPGEDAFGARLISADLGDLSFITVYVPNGKSVMHDDFSRKLAWLDALGRYLKETMSHARPTILCGDFNICPSRLDSWNEDLLHGQIFHTDEERARLQRLLDIGFVDIYRERFPDIQEFSWWDYRGGAFHKKQGLRIDLLLATKSVMARIDDVAIDREYRKKKDGITPSDHAPVFADLV